MRTGTPPPATPCAVCGSILAISPAVYREADVPAWICYQCIADLFNEMRVKTIEVGGRVVGPRDI